MYLAFLSTLFYIRMFFKQKEIENDFWSIKGYKDR